MFIYVGGFISHCCNICGCFFKFQAFTILVTNALRVAAINSIGDFVLFLGKLGVMAATAAFGIIWFKVSLNLLLPYSCTCN